MVYLLQQEIWLIVKWLARYSQSTLLIKYYFIILIFFALAFLSQHCQVLQHVPFPQPSSTMLQRNPCTSCSPIWHPCYHCRHPHHLLLWPWSQPSLVTTSSSNSQCRCHQPLPALTDPCPLLTRCSTMAWSNLPTNATSPTNQQRRRYQHIRGPKREGTKGETQIATKRARSTSSLWNSPSLGFEIEDLKQSMSGEELQLVDLPKELSVPQLERWTQKHKRRRDWQVLLVVNDCLMLLGLSTPRRISISQQIWRQTE